MGSSAGEFGSGGRAEGAEQNTSSNHLTALPLVHVAVCWGRGCEKDNGAWHLTMLLRVVGGGGTRRR